MHLFVFLLSQPINKKIPTQHGNNLQIDAGVVIIKLTNKRHKCRYKEGTLMSGLMRNRRYLILMVAQAISGIGDWLSIVAIITLVGLKWNASPLEVSFIILFLAVPMVVLGPFAGTVADRFNRKVLMLTSDLVRAGLILILAFVDTLWGVYICLFAIGAFSTVFIPAKNGKLKELVKTEEMKSAMAITAMIDSSTKVIGPLISGVLVAAFSTQLVFYMDAATFAISALLILFLPGVATSLEEKEGNADRIPSSFKDDFLVGIAFIKSNTYIMIGMCLLGFSLLILQLSDSQLIVLVRELTAASPDLFGYIVAASGIGMLLAGLFLAKKTDYKAFTLMLIGVCGIGLSFGTIAVLTYFDVRLSILWAPLLGLFAGLSASLVLVPFQATVQVATPVHMTGRVFGVINSVTTSATIFGPLLGGLLATILGVVPTFMITAALLVLVAIIGWTMKRKTERKKAMSPKVTEEHFIQRRAKILEAATQVFIEHGYERTTMKHVMDAANVSRGGLYQYFSNKEDLYEAILEENLAKEIRHTQELLGEQVDSYWELLLVKLFGADQAPGEKVDALAPTNLEFFITGRNEAGRKKYVEARYHNAIRMLSDIIKAGQKSGEFNKTQDSETIARYILTFVDGLALSHAIIPTEQLKMKEQAVFFLGSLKMALLEK